MYHQLYQQIPVHHSISPESAQRLRKVYGFGAIFVHVSATWLPTRVWLELPVVIENKGWANGDALRRPARLPTGVI